MKDFAANLTFFILEHTGSVFGTWHGKMKASAQRELMGRFIGKGTIVINGENETVRNRVKVCFGLDYDDRNIFSFAELGVEQSHIHCRPMPPHAARAVTGADGVTHLKALL